MSGYQSPEDEYRRYESEDDQSEDEYRRYESEDEYRSTESGRTRYGGYGVYPTRVHPSSYPPACRLPLPLRQVC